MKKCNIHVDHDHTCILHTILSLRYNGNYRIQWIYINIYQAYNLYHTRNILSEKIYPPIFGSFSYTTPTYTNIESTNTGKSFSSWLDKKHLLMLLYVRSGVRKNSGRLPGKNMSDWNIWQLILCQKAKNQIYQLLGIPWHLWRSISYIFTLHNQVSAHVKEVGCVTLWNVISDTSSAL